MIEIELNGTTLHSRRLERANREAGFSTEFDQVSSAEAKKSAALKTGNVGKRTLEGTGVGGGVFGDVVLFVVHISLNSLSHKNSSVFVTSIFLFIKNPSRNLKKKL